MNTVGVGMIGCGGYGTAVARNVLAQDKRIRLRGLYDPQAASVERARKALGDEAAGAVAYESLEALLAAPDIQWVMIASWNCFHREQTVAALEAGKHVFCQKPLATTPEDCLAMYRAWQDSGLAFNIGFTLRYSPHYRKVRELIASGAIGRLISFEFNETLDFNHGGFIMGDWRRLTKNAGTHLLEKCCHDVDLANWMVGRRVRRVASFGGLDFFRPENAGEVERVGPHPDGRPAFQTWAHANRAGPCLNPFTADKDIVDNQVAILEYEGGVRATFHANCSTAIPERRMYLCGSEGTIRADVIAGTIELHRIGFGTEIERVDSGVAGGHGGGDDVLGREVAATMLDGVPPATSMDDAIASAFTCFAVDEAMATGQVVEAAKYWAMLDAAKGR